MSEPIQSISQGNYILATQQEVSHDNTLSGDGTVANPLGVVNGYNETVLANNLVFSSTTLTLSEPAGNFERLRLYDYYGTITEIQGNNSRLTWVFDRTDQNNTRMNRCYTITSNNGIDWNEVNVYGWNQNNYNGITANGGTDWYLETIKVVGINRKQ